MDWYKSRYSKFHDSENTQLSSLVVDLRRNIVPITGKTAVRATIFLFMSYLLLYPILSSPVIADDFVNPFYQGLFYKANDQSALIEALRFGWRSGTELANFRVIGGLIGSFWLWLWITLSANLHVSMHSLYMLTKFIVYIVAVISISTFWWSASNHYGRGIRYWDGLVLSSVALFGTLQNHGLWSSDPVVSFPLAGYGSTAISFGVLTAAVLAAHHQRRRFFLLAVSSSTISILYYELNLGAVLGAGIILGAGCWVHRSDRQKLRYNLTCTAMVLGIPALILLYGRRVALDNSVAYNGTGFSITGMPKAFVLGIANGFPGSAWGTTIGRLDDPVVLIGFSLGTVVVLACLLLWWRRTASSLKIDLRRNSNEDATMRVAIVVGVIVCALCAIGLQAMTIKVQLETPGLGYVYTHYAISSGVVALGIAIIARSLLVMRRVATVQVLAIAAGLIIIYVQSTINWQVTKQLNEVVAPNRQLLSAFDNKTDELVRCEALKTWTAGGWPDSYEIDMVNGLQHSYLIYFGEPFCRGFVRAN